MRAHSRFDFSFAFILFRFELTASNSFDLNLNLKIVCVCFVAKYNEKIKMNGFLKYLMKLGTLHKRPQFVFDYFIASQITNNRLENDNRQIR